MRFPRMFSLKASARTGVAHAEHGAGARTGRRIADNCLPHLRQARGTAGLALGLVLAVFATAGASAAGPKAYVGLFKDNAVAVLDTGTDRLLTTIPIPPGPHGLVMAPDGSAVYASSDGDTTVSVIDTAQDVVTASIPVGPSPHGLAMTPDGRTVLAAVFGASQVVSIDTATRTVVGSAAVPNPHNIAISPDGRTAYVAAQGKGAIVVLDVATLRQTGVVPLDKIPRALSVSPDGKDLYFTLAGSDAVQVLDTATSSIVERVPVGASPHLPLADAREVLVVSQGPGTLSLIDPATGRVSGIVKVGTLPHWIASARGGRDAWVTDEGSNDVSVVDLDTMTVVATIPVGNAPRKIVVQPGAAVSSLAPPSAAAAQTRISGFAFDDTLAVTAGDSVTWTNADPVPHTVTSDTGLWASGDIAAGARFSMRFTTPGSHGYHCEMHPSMRGTVIVKSAA